MKKFFSILLAALMICMLTACGSSDEKNSTSPAQNNKKILVAYFSCTGNTKKAALEVAEMLHADTFEIIPAEPYTSDDLNYNVETCRASIEQKDSNSRPAIEKKIDNFAQYKAIVIAFPIWWGAEPRIVDTFVESYDFAGKIVVPVCTSGGSEVQTAAKNLQALCKGATFKNGRRLGIISADEVKAWLDSLKL